MSTAKIRWGILGLGRIAETFSNAVAESEYATLQSVASRDLNKASTFAKSFGASNAHEDYESLLADDSVDAIYIATPHPYHAEWAVKCAEAGKHILCEKPITMNHREALTVMQAVKQHDVFFMEAFMYRFHPQTDQVLEWITSGEIGEVRMIAAHIGFDSGSDVTSRLLAKELGGGAILDVGCYPASFTRLIAGAALKQQFQNPESIKAVGHLHPETGVDSWTTAVL